MFKLLNSLSRSEYREKLDLGSFKLARFNLTVFNDELWNCGFAEVTERKFHFESTNYKIFAVSRKIVGTEREREAKNLAF